MALCPNCGKKSVYKGEQKIIGGGTASLFDCREHGSFIDPRDRAYVAKHIADRKNKRRK